MTIHGCSELQLVVSEQLGRTPLGEEGGTYQIAIHTSCPIVHLDQRIAHDIFDKRARVQLSKYKAE